MKNYLMNLLKNNKIVYWLYSSIFNICLAILRVFIKVDEKVILLNSFGGKKYDDSPKAIFEYMIKNPKYDKYTFYWGIDEPERVNIPRAIVIKNNSLKYFMVALKAKYWITNSSIERGLKFKNKKSKAPKRTSEPYAF